jgi:hypothetical protein
VWSGSLDHDVSPWRGKESIKWACILSMSDLPRWTSRCGSHNLLLFYPLIMDFNVQEQVLSPYTWQDMGLWPFILLFWVPMKDMYLSHLSFCNVIVSLKLQWMRQQVTIDGSMFGPLKTTEVICFCITSLDCGSERLLFLKTIKIMLIYKH